MARFQNGNTDGRKISGEIATEMQKRSVEARRRNTTLREAMLEALAEESAPGAGTTRMEALARKALANHYNGKLTFKDLKDLSSVIGEDVLHITTDGPQIVPMPPEAIEALSKWVGKGRNASAQGSEE